MYIKVIGQGPDLVMLHGWSMHSAVWHDMAEVLAENFTLHLVDLPGHGLSDWQENALDLDVLLTHLAVEIPRQAYWLGWSLGGLISIAFTDKFPERVTKLILVAATPCFVKNVDWPYAMEPEIFDTFADSLKDNQAETLQKFLILQARGSTQSRHTIRQLAEKLASEQAPVKAALTAGLHLLVTTDMTRQLAKLTCPVKMILGDCDSLIPATMLMGAKQLQPNLDTSVLTGAGHAPFISQPKQCQQAIESFINEQ
jgi:pimeloyl-[acyl-carrier protein] methyl ester esterase